MHVKHSLGINRKQYRNVLTCTKKIPLQSETMAVTKALIGSGVDIHIFAFCPTNFFWNQLPLRLISKEIRRTEREYINMHPPPPQLTL